MPRPAFRKPAEIRGLLQATLAAHLDEPQHLERLARAAKPLSFKHREPLWTSGDTGTLAYILDGAFDIIHNHVVVDTIGPRQFLGISSIFDKPHKEDTRARKTEKYQSPTILLWNTSNPETRVLFSSAGMLKMLLNEAQALIHHLNELQVLYRRRRGAVAHVASHLLRLAHHHESCEEVVIGQRELGVLAGYDERTVRLALAELMSAGCIRKLRRSEYHIDIDALTRFIEMEKLGGSERLGSGSIPTDTD